MKTLDHFREGGIVDVREAEKWLAQELDALASKGAMCLIVEDDLSRATDPGPINDGIPSAFIDDRVVSWHELSPGKGASAFKEVMYVGSGYPRNAFVTSRSASELGLANATQVPNDFPRRVAESLIAVIISIFDDESYLVWTP